MSCYWVATCGFYSALIIIHRHYFNYTIKEIKDLIKSQGVGKVYKLFLFYVLVNFTLLYRVAIFLKVTNNLSHFFICLGYINLLFIIFLLVWILVKIVLTCLYILVLFIYNIFSKLIQFFINAKNKVYWSKPKKRLIYVLLMLTLLLLYLYHVYF